VDALCGHGNNGFVRQRRWRLLMMEEKKRVSRRLDINEVSLVILFREGINSSRWTILRMYEDSLRRLRGETRLASYFQLAGHLLG